MVDNRSVVHVLGAGVDRHLGMPLADQIIGKVAEFADGEGKPIARVLRSCLPHLRFSFAKYTGEQGETLAARVLAENTQALSEVKTIMRRFLNDQDDHNTRHIRVVYDVIDRLDQIRDSNQIDDESLAILAEIGGETVKESGGDTIVDPRGIALTPTVRRAFRRTFQGLRVDDRVSSEERSALTDVSMLFMNVEELLGDLFSGFYTNRLPDQKKYLYVAWLIWAYVRIRMEKAGSADKGLYDSLDNLGDEHEFITMNYTTNFLSERSRERTQFFHGDCLSYIRLETRDVIRNDENLQEASSAEKIAEFIEGLNIDVKSKKVYLPGIIPPLLMKPVITREHLDTWYKTGQLIDRANRLLITGYSFSTVDEHFNDLIRKRRGSTASKIIVINPDLEQTVANVTEILGRNTSHLNDTAVANFKCRQSRDLLFVKARAEQLTPADIDKFLR